MTQLPALREQPSQPRFSSKPFMRFADTFVSTLGSILDYDFTLYGKCRRCNHLYEVDVETLASRYGRDFYILSRVLPCPHTGCSGKATLLYMPEGEQQLHTVTMITPDEDPIFRRSQSAFWEKLFLKKQKEEPA